MRTAESCRFFWNQTVRSWFAMALVVFAFGFSERVAAQETKQSDPSVIFLTGSVSVFNCPDRGALTPSTNIFKPSPVLNRAIRQLMTDRGADPQTIWKLARHLLLYRKYMVGFLWDQRVALQTELVRFGQVPIASERLAQATELAFPETIFPDFFAAHMIQHEAILAQGATFSVDEEMLKDRLEKVLKESLQLLDFDRLIQIERKKITDLEDPEKTRNDRTHRLSSHGMPITHTEKLDVDPSVLEVIHTRIDRLRQAQRLAVPNPILFTPVDYYDSAISQLNRPFYLRVVSELSLSHLDSRRPHPRLYHKLAFLALTMAGEDYLNDPGYLTDIPLPEPSEKVTALIHQKMLSGLSKALKHNEEALLAIYRMTDPGKLEKMLRGSLGTRAPIHQQISEPDDIQSLIETFLKLVPFLSSSPVISESIEVNYGIPIVEQQRINTALVDLHRRKEKKEERRRANSQKIGMITLVGLLPIAIWAEAPVLLLGIGLIEGVYWFAVISDQIYETENMADLAYSLYYTLDHPYQLSISLDQLDRYVVFEKDALKQYFIALGILGADVAGMSYLRFVKKARLFGKTAVALEDIEVEAMQQRIGGLVDELEEIKRISEATTDLTQISGRMSALSNRATAIARTIEGEELKDVQKLADALWKHRNTLDDEIAKLREAINLKQVVNGKLKNPNRLWFEVVSDGKTSQRRIFELDRPKFEAQLEKFLDQVEQDLQRNQLRRLMIRRWACERTQKISIKPMVSPGNHPSVRKWAGRVKRAGTALNKQLPFLQTFAKGEHQLLVSMDNWIAWLRSTRVGGSWINFFSEMNYGWMGKFQTRWVSKGMIRRFAQVQRDHFIYTNAGDLLARKDRKKEFKDVVLNYVVGVAQNFGRTWTSRANITVQRRLAVGATITMGASTIGSFVMNDLYGNDVLDDPCLGAILSRSVGNPLYAAVVSEPKGRVAEILRLLVEKSEGKQSLHSNAILTGITIADKAFGGFLWVKGSKLVDIQGRCAEEDPELAKMLEHVVVQRIPEDATLSFAQMLEEEHGAIFGETDELMGNRSVPEEALEFFSQDPFGTEDL